MPATETRTGPSAYTDRLIKLFEADDNTARAKTYFGALAHLATPQGIDFILQHASPTEDQNVWEGAQAALDRIKTNALLIPLARRVVPNVLEQHNITGHTLPRIALPERAHLVADLIPSSVDIYTRLDRATHRTDSGPKNEGLKYLAGLTIRRAVMAATELPSDQELTYQAVVKAFNGRFLGRTGLELAQQFLTSGGDQAVAAITQLMSDQIRRSNAVEMLLSINSEASRDVVVRNLDKIEPHQANVNQLAQTGDLRFRDRIVSLLAGSKSEKDRWMHFQTGHDSRVAIDFLTAASGDDAEHQKELGRVLKSQAKSTHQQTAEAAIRQLIDSGKPDALEQAFAAASQTGNGLDQFVELAKTGRVDIMQKLVAMLAEPGIVYRPAQRAAQESLRGLNTSHPELLTQAVGNFLTETVSTRTINFNAYRVNQFAVEQELSGLIPTLKELLSKDRDNSTAFTLAKLANADGVQFMLDRLANEPNPKTRGFVAAAIEAIPFNKFDNIDPAQAKKLERLSGGNIQTLRQKVIAGLITSAWNDSEAQVRSSALHSLGKIGDPEVAELLLEKLLSDQNPNVAYFATSASEEIRNRYSKPAGSTSDVAGEDN